MIFLFGNRIDGFWEKEIGKLRSEFPEHQFIIPQNQDMREMIARTADGIVIGALEISYLKNADNLKILFVPWTGLDRLPLKLLQEKNCIVANTHGNSNAVAERAFSLCLALLGRIPSYDHDLRNGIWHGFSVNSPEEDKWTSLQNKTIGIIGFGVIGQKIAEFLQPFHCKINALKKHKNKQKNSKKVVYLETIDEIIDKSEIIFLLLPLTNETRFIINRERLQKMTGKYLINMGRGDLIVEKDLFEALQNNLLKGLAMDVWYQYPSKVNKIVLPSKYPFQNLQNVVLSPHVGGFCFEGHHEMMLDTIENIRIYILTGKPNHLANLSEGY